MTPVNADWSAYVKVTPVDVSSPLREYVSEDMIICSVCLRFSHAPYTSLRCVSVGAHADTLPVPGLVKLHAGHRLGLLLANEQYGLKVEL